MATGPKVLKRGWGAEGWRDTKTGMWAWLIQRAAAVLLLLVVALHLTNPFRRGVQAVRNSGTKGIKYAEAFQRVYPQVTDQLS